MGPQKDLGKIQLLFDKRNLSLLDKYLNKQILFFINPKQGAWEYCVKRLIINTVKNVAIGAEENSREIRTKILLDICRYNFVRIYVNTFESSDYKRKMGLKTQ